MSGAVQDVLVDSNAYFRLARSITPLLGPPFGDAPAFSLYVLAELDDEYQTSSRLQNKFEWVQDREHADDRKAKRYTLKGKDLEPVRRAVTFMDRYASQEGLNMSREDLRALAAGFVKGLPVVTDDRAMQTVAKAHGIPCWSSIKLLKAMVVGGRIDLAQVAEILEYWEYENDLPAAKPALRAEYRKYFGGVCPI